MYQDVRNRKWIILFLLVAAVAFLMGRFFLSQKTRFDIEEESALSIKTAVEQAALQCYVIEGAYPEDLQYLKDNYGLQVNTESYLIVYRAFADNRVPDIRVVKRDR